MEVKKIDNVKVSLCSQVRIKEMGNITELMWSDSYTSKCNIKKIDKDHYIQLDTGEMKEFKHIENRAGDLKSVSKSLGKLRDLLNANITDVSKCRWVTLTYGENMTDTKKLQVDFKHFNTRLREKIGHYEYIVAMEPQGRGAWHCHVVMIFENKAPFITPETMWSCWSPKGYKDKLKGGSGYDFVTVKKLDDVDNVGAYLTAYLGDLDLDEVKNIDTAMNVQGLSIKEVDLDGKSKKYIKGGRLHMYPPKFNIYRKSKGIIEPLVYYDSEEQAQKKVSAGTLTFEKTIRLEDQENSFEKTINYRYYNKIRKE